MSKATSNIKQTLASQKALELAERFNLRLTSGYRTPEHDRRVGGSGHGDHTQGEAYDFAGGWNNMLAFADWAHKSGLFTQVIFQNKDYRTGRYIGGHMDHVHVSWDSTKNKTGTEYKDPSSPLVRKGEKAEFVKVIQELLGSIDVDGFFGPQTETAVKEFQKQHGLEVDGIVGPITWNSLTKGGHKFFFTES